jgi:hypothetical protein
VATQHLIEALREVIADAARLRFDTNFATPVCDRCEGLNAGPGVIATCFQLRQCHYGNVSEDSITPRQRRVLDVMQRLSGTQGSGDR